MNHLYVKRKMKSKNKKADEVNLSTTEEFFPSDSGQFNSNHTGSENDLDLPEDTQNKLLIKDLQTRISMLVSASKREQENHQKEIEKLQTQLNETYNEAQKSQSTLENDIYVSQNEVRDLSRKVQEINTFFEQLNDRFQINAHSFSDVINIVSTLVSKIDIKESEIEDMNSTNFEYKDKLSETNQALQEACHQVKTLRKQIKRMSVNDEIHQFYEEKINKIKEHKEQKIALLSDDIKDKEIEIAKLKSKIDVLENTTKPEIIQFTPTKDENAISKISMLQRDLMNSQSKYKKISNEYDTIAKQVEDYKHKEMQLNNKITILESKIQTLEESNKQQKDRIKTLKTQNESLKKDVTTKDTKIAEFSTTISELQLELNEIKSQKFEVQTIDIPKTNECIDKSSLNDALSRFEEIIQSQSEELNQLYQQRSTLIQTIQNLNCSVSGVEQYIIDLVQENRQLSNNYETLTQDLEELDKNNEHDWNKVIAAIHELLPEFQEEQDDHIHFCINAIKHAVSIQPELETDINEMEKLEKQNVELVSHLENMIKFLRSLSETSKTTTEKSIILSQCARVGIYMEEINLKPKSIPSLFKPHEVKDPETIAELCLAFANESEMKETPFTELFDLMCILAEVNSILMDNIGDYQQRLSQVPMSNDTHDVQKLEAELQSISLSDENNQIFIENIINILKEVVEKPSDDVEEMINQLIVNVNELNQIKEENNALKAEIDEIKEESAKERAIFEKKAERIVNEIQSKIESMTIDSQETNEANEELKSQNEELLKKLDEANENIDKKKTKIEKLVEENKQLVDSIERMEEKAKSDKLGVFNEIDEINAQLESIRQQNMHLEDQIKQVNEKKRIYKQKFEECEEKNSGILSELRTRSDELRSKYSATVERLENDLKEARTQIENLETEASKFNETKQRLIVENARLQVSERSLTLKINSIENALNRERKAFEEKKVIMNMNFQNEISSLHENYELEKQEIMAPILEAFNVTSIDDIIKSREYNDMILSDAIKARTCLKIDDNESLENAIHELENQIYEQEKIIKEQEKQTAHMSEAIRENEKLRHIVADNKEWLRWSKALYRQITRDTCGECNEKDIKFTIQEAIISSMGHITFRKKLELLRLEKKLILKQQNLTYFRNGNRKEKVVSIRPIMICTLFARRLGAIRVVHTNPKFNSPSKQTKPKFSLVPFE